MVNAILLSTKLHVPSSRTIHLQRPRLNLLLQDALSHKLTLISAPPGFGKTVLVSEWLSSLSPRQASIAWLSLDQNDNDFTRFWSYLIAALQTVSPELGRNALDLLESPQTVPREWLLTTLINEIDDFAQHL